MKTSPTGLSLAEPSVQFIDADSPTNTRVYTETYAYDEVGGLTQLAHQYGGSAKWVRDYTSEAGSNRMTGLAVGANTYTYAYDSGGNLTQENTERHFEWDFAGRMRAFRNQVPGSVATVFAHYGYDGGGERVQKVVTKGQKTTRTVYIDGIFEHQQVIENDAVTVENQTLHLMDDARRVATYRAGPELDGVQRRDSATEPVRLVGRTLFGHEMTGDPKTTNHLGKPHRVFDEAGVVELQTYDFKGNVLEKTRQVIDPKKMIDAVSAADSEGGYVVDTFGAQTALGRLEVSAHLIQHLLQGRQFDRLGQVDVKAGFAALGHIFGSTITA